jgi:CII-binding regulator of phage lambda lysogenization HflD
MSNFGNLTAKEKVRAKRRLKALEKKEAILVKKIKAYEKQIASNNNDIENIFNKMAAIYLDPNNYV